MTHHLMMIVMTALRAVPFSLDVSSHGLAVKEPDVDIDEQCDDEANSHSFQTAVD